jgi:hypothetical protein
LAAHSYGGVHRETGNADTELPTVIIWLINRNRGLLSCVSLIILFWKRIIEIRNNESEEIVSIFVFDEFSEISALGIVPVHKGWPLNSSFHWLSPPLVATSLLFL